MKIKIVNEKGGYGGFLPTLTEWTKMTFEGPGKYIWIKTTGDGFIAADNCLIQVLQLILIKYLLGELE